jgi:hypothetical protein
MWGRDPKLAHFLAQRIPIDTQERGGSDLVATALMHDNRQQQLFDIR